MYVFFLNESILLMCIWARNLMMDVMLMEKIGKASVFTLTINLYGFNFSVKVVLNQGLQMQENIVQFPFGFEKIKPDKFARVINEAYIVSVYIGRSYG